MRGEQLKHSFAETQYAQLVGKFEKTFDDGMRDLLQVLTHGKRYETHIANLATRLDYNGYYSQIFSD